LIPFCDESSIDPIIVKGVTIKTRLKLKSYSFGSAVFNGR
jgi:hypothetical protein